MKSTTQHPSIRLKNLRLVLNLSQRELAQEFMVSNGAIASWELGSNPIPGPIIKLIDIYEQKTISLESDHNQLMEEFKVLIKNFKSNSHDLLVIEKFLNSYMPELSFTNQISAKIKYIALKQLLNILSSAKGATVKLVQLLSYLEIGVPNDVRLALGNLQSKLKSMDKQQVLQILNKEYGNYEAIFKNLNFTPLAVTSLGQVHYAVLKNGNEVAVKIQQANIHTILKSQFKKMDLLEMLLRSSNPDISLLFSEIKNAITLECDYLLEAKNQIKIKSLIEKFPRTIVPNVYLELCKKNILISEFVHADNFHGFCQKSSQDSKNVVAEAFIRNLSYLAFNQKLVLSDIHSENFLVKNDKVVYLDFGRIFLPHPARIRNEIIFYRHLILNQKTEAKLMIDRIGFAKDPKNFNFDEFWLFMRNSSQHLLRDEPFKFTQDYIANISREGKKFSHKRQLSFSPDVFWGFTFSAGTWAMFAELEAECNWHRIALETFNEVLIE